MGKILAMSVVVVAGLALLGAGEEKGPAAGDKGSNTEKLPPYKPVAPILVLMEHIDEILANSWKRIDTKEFKKLKTDAQFLSELLNVVFYYKPNKDWGTWSRKCREQLLELASQSEKGNGEALKAAFDSIDTTCSACHDKYRD